MRLKCVAVLPFVFCALLGPAPTVRSTAEIDAAMARMWAWPDSASAGQSKAKIDVVMARIYAACEGEWKGENHERSISRGTNWTTESVQYTCTSPGPGKFNLNGKTGNTSWEEAFRIENGVQYQKGSDSNGESWSDECKITNAWFSDESHHGFECTFVDKLSGGEEYEGIFTTVVIGDLFVSLRRARKKASGDDYRYDRLSSHRRVK